MLTAPQTGAEGMNQTALCPALCGHHPEVHLNHSLQQIQGKSHLSQCWCKAMQ